MRLRHLTDAEIQQYLEDFRGQGRVAVDSLENNVREHLERCTHCRTELREYAHLFSDLACQPEPSLPNAFAYKLLSILPKHRLVPPVIVVPVTLGWVYCCLVAVVWWFSSLNWLAIQTRLTGGVVDLMLLARSAASFWLPSFDLGMIWLSFQHRLISSAGSALDMLQNVVIDGRVLAVIITALVLLIACADSGLPTGFLLSRRRTRH